VAWTTTELLADIRRRARLSTTDPDHTDANLLLDADGQMDELIVPLVLGANSDFYVRTEDQPITVGQALYPVPSRAVANVPRQVFVVDSSGQAVELPHVPMNDRYNYPPTGSPCAYTMQDDCVLLLPTPESTADTLRIAYEYQPGKLVLPSACGLTIDVAVATGIVECALVPTTWTGATLLDIVRGTSPFSLLAENLNPAAVTTGALGFVTFAVADLPPAQRFANESFGDYLCPTGTTCLPQIPADLHSVLALAVAVEVLDQVGDPLAQGMRGKLELAVRRAAGKLQPRVKGAPHKIVSRNSYLRRGRGRWAASR
jgi:hypothetical protein